MSWLRLRKAIEVPQTVQERAALATLVAQARQSSLILHLAEDGAPLDPYVASMLFDLSAGVRLIVLASTPEVARGALTSAWFQRMQHVEVRPLAFRRGEISRLLDRRFEEGDSARRTADLTPENQEALKAHDWPRNFDELREIADAIIAHDALGGLRPAAESLGMSSHKKLARRFERIGLELPLFSPED